MPGALETGKGGVAALGTIGTNDETRMTNDETQALRVSAFGVRHNEFQSVEDADLPN